jgi:hypothetical protein
MFKKPEEGNNHDEYNALIVDGLPDFPNKSLIEEMKCILINEGFEVDEVEPKNVTVNFYKSLPSMDYDLIILRIHCGPLIRKNQNGSYISSGTVFFTTELYQTDKYKGLQSRGLLAIAKKSGDDNGFFSIPPDFFESLDDWNTNTNLILSSCYGLWEGSPFKMAETLRDKGVRLFIGWDGEVSAHHTDKAVLALLKQLYVEEKTVSESIKFVMDEIGPDKYYGAKLDFYPTESGDMLLKK